LVSNTYNPDTIPTVKKNNSNINLAILSVSGLSDGKALPNTQKYVTPKTIGIKLKNKYTKPGLITITSCFDFILPPTPVFDKEHKKAATKKIKYLSGNSHLSIK